MRRMIRRWAIDEEGASAIEYALVASLISVTLVGALTVTGARLSARIESIGEAIGNAGR